MTATEPSAALVVGSLFLSLLAAWLWPITRYVITIAHEGAHALTGSATGGRIDYIRVKTNGDGDTQVLDDHSKLLTGLAGYAGPSMFGVLGAILLAHGVRPDAVLWTTVVLIGAVFIQAKNFFGVLVTVATGLVFFLIARNASAQVREWCVYTLVWFLLVGGVKGIADHGRGAGDAAKLREWFKLPRGFWAGIWWLATLAGLVYGGGILFGVIDAPGA